MWTVILSLCGGGLLLLVALAITKMSKDVTKCTCGEWAEFIDESPNGEYIYKCPKCGKVIKL
jgi:hypothetical protein